MAFDFTDPVPVKIVEPNSNASPLSSLKIEVEKGVGRPWSDRARPIEIERSFALRWRGWFGGAQSCFPRAGGGGFHFKHDVAGIGHANADRAPIVRSADIFAHSHYFKNWLRALCLLVEEAGLFEAAIGGKAGGKSGDCGGEEGRVLQVQLRIPFENHWRVTKGAGNRGGKQASAVCENTAGRGSPSVAFADRGQARLQVAPKTSLLNLGRVGADRAARPVFSVCGRRTAKRFAAQQVVFSLLALPLLGCRQKSVCFCFGIGVNFTLKYFDYACRVGSHLVSDMRSFDALNAHDMRCYSVFEREFWSPFGDYVQFDTSNVVSFRRGFFPKQVGHEFVSFADMVGRIALGVSGILPAILWFRAVCKGAVSLAGVATANCRPGTPIQSHFWQIWTSGNPVDNLGVVVGNLGRFCGLRLLAVPQ
ncbi:hypothetical protein [Pseudophaeobacter sp.]|jgi:hypothetical protein|uniref:hypothetical protein n=1 Tax=Pseudophaeobacter sp. TaxID=1971739 RepID=UPI0032D8E614